MTEYHQKFNQACDEAGLPRNAGKQLIHAVAGGMQGGFFDGRRGILKLGPDKLRNYIQLSLQNALGVSITCVTGRERRPLWPPSAALCSPALDECLIQSN